MMSIRSTGPNSQKREPLDGMTDNMLTIRLADALGTTSPEFIDEMLSLLAGSFGPSHDRRNTREINAALAVLDGVKPENEVEAMLLTQMIATNNAAMRCLASISQPFGVDTFGNLGVKLLRTFTAQAEALAKLRRKGEQTVRVVHVHPGGQAVVGDVHNHPTGGRGQLSGNGGQSDATGNSGESPALPSPNEIGEAVPVTRGRRKAKVPHARRDKPGCA
ncbi:MAG: hypothetical protein KAF42_02050 [Sphingopyxis terrae]|nr:hypothetical protein [Sphingopyxis terrae]